MAPRRGSEMNVQVSAPNKVEIPTSAGPLLGAWHDPRGEVEVKGVAVLAPGVAVPARVTAPLADALAARGWRTLRIEFHGVGSSPLDPRQVPGGMAEWGSRDLDAALRTAAVDARAAGLPLVLVGHSAGAWLISLTTMAEEVDAVLALASMSGYWGDLKRAAWPRMLPAFFGLIPVVTRVLGYVPAWAGLGEDAPGTALREWAMWCRHPDFLFSRPELATSMHRLTAPVRVLLPLDDEWATEASVRAVWDRAAGPVEVVMVDPAAHGGRIGHLGLLREHIAAGLWQEQISWLDAVTRR